VSVDVCPRPVGSERLATQMATRTRFFRGFGRSTVDQRGSRLRLHPAEQRRRALGRRHARSHERPGKHAGHSVEDVTCFLEDGNRPDEADSLHSSALQNEIGGSSQLDFFHSALRDLSSAEQSLPAIDCSPSRRRFQTRGVESPSADASVVPGRITSQHKRSVGINRIVARA